MIALIDSEVDGNHEETLMKEMEAISNCCCNDAGEILFEMMRSKKLNYGNYDAY
jgi:hypothetical protein